MAKPSWSVLWVSFFIGVVAALVQFAIPPLLPSIREQYQVSYTDSALLMSLFALATVASSVPGGFILPKIGVRTMGLWGLILLLIGLAGFSLVKSFPLLVLMRIIQGLGFGLIATAAPSAIGQYMPREKLSIAMGIWSAWIPVGSTTVFFFAPKILHSFPIAVYWIILIVLTVSGMIFFLHTIPRRKTKDNNAYTPSKREILDELKNTNLWWAGMGFATYTLTFLTFNTWIVTVLVESSSMSLAAATIIPALLAVFAIGSNVFAGVIFKKTDYPLMLFILPPLAIACLWPMFTMDSLPLFYSSAVLIGILAGFAPALMFTATPLLARRRETIGIGMSILIFMQNAGGLIGPQIFGFLRQNTGSFASGFWMLFFSSLCTVFACYKIWQTGIFGTGIKNVLSRKA